MPEHPFKLRLNKGTYEIVPADTKDIVPVRPEEETVGSAVDPAYQALAESMSSFQAEAAASFSGLFQGLRVKAGSAGDSLGAEFAALGPGLVQRMGFKPAGLETLSHLRREAQSALASMNPTEAFAAAVSLTAVAQLLGTKRNHSGSGATASSNGGGASSAGGPATVQPLRQVNLFVDGRWVDSPTELEAVLAGVGVASALRASFRNLML